MKHLLIFVSKYKALYLLRNFAHLYSFGSLLFYKSIFLFLFYSILLYNHASQENLQDKVFSGNSSFYPSSLPGSFNPFHRESFFLFICGLKVKVTQSCPTLCDPMDYTVHRILQARILEWVAFPSI